MNTAMTPRPIRYNVHFFDGKVMTVEADTAAKARRIACKARPYAIFLYTSKVRSVRVHGS